MFYVGVSPTAGGINGKGAIFHRISAKDQPTMLGSYPGAAVVSIAINRDDYRHVFVTDTQNHIWGSLDEGQTWSNLTPPFSADSLPIVTKVETGPGSALPTLFAGGLGLSRCVITKRDGGFDCTWSRIDADNLKAMITDLRFEPMSNRLVVATLGRGAWLYGFATTIHRLPYMFEPSARFCAKKLTCAGDQD